MSFADKVKKLVEEAPVASAGTNMNFGPTTFTPIIVKWDNGRGNPPTKTPLSEYMKANGLKDSDPLELEPGESLQLHVDVDITALNPSLDFHYERDIAILESNKSNKDPKKWLLTNWSEVVHPSLEAVFGKNWYDKILPNGKGVPPVLYTASEAVETVEPVKEGKKSYSVPKFLAVYKDLDACRKARDERYPPRDEEAEMAFGPDGEEAEEGNGEFPEDVISQVQDLYRSTRKNKKQTLKMLESQPFGDYEAEELLKAAVPEAFPE